MNPFQRIIDTLSNAFSILDFSYTVSGGATLAVILFDWCYVHQNNSLLSKQTKLPSQHSE